MTYYELKKVLTKTGSKAAIGVVLVITVIMSYLAVNDVTYVKPDGESEQGRKAAVKLREEKEKWEGSLSVEKISRAISENKRINRTPQARSEDINEQNKAYAKEQGYEDIRLLISESYKNGTFDYFMIDSLRPKDAADFYDNRTRNLKEWLADENGGASRFSQEEKQFLIGEYEKMETPLQYKAADGWNQLFYRLLPLLMILALTCVFLVSAVFSCESQLKADSVFYTCFHGRKKGVRAKILAGFLLITGVYWIGTLLYTLIVLVALGTGGMNCMIQTLSSGWESFYNITIGQKFLLVLAGGYIGCLFFSFLSMLLSVKIKSAVVAVILPFLLLLLPSVFFSSAQIPILEKILGLLPHKLLWVEQSISEFVLYSLGGHVAGAIEILLPLYCALTLVIAPLLYRIFRKAQVK